MDVAVVAPCPIPYAIGGAENLWRGLQDALNAVPGVQAEVLKLPTPERTTWEVLDGYRRFAALDVSGFDVVVTGKYPAWMVDHPRHVVYMLHPLRGLYDTYHFFGLPLEVVDPPAEVAALLTFLDAHEGRRDALPELWERLDGLRAREAALPAGLLAFPGPLVRRLVHWLDGVALSPDAVVRHAAISATVRDRPGYFPGGVDALVVHPPTAVPARPGRDRGYLFTASRLDGAKRIELLVQAMGHVRSDARLRIAGTGPEADRLAALAADQPRVELLGRVPEARLAEEFGGARAVAFVPFEEDYGYTALEALRSGKPVVTCTDSGGATELVEHGVTGLVAEPSPEAVAAAIDELWRSPRRTRKMGEEGARRAAAVRWDPIVDAIRAAGAAPAPVPPASASASAAVGAAT